ncbi:hypothetical protein [Streptomyces sp. AS02]|uniref:hypothetical protein n=1 Tax=Streptomyces sp. AS02 TaxID=2938946 RepID=UPI0020224DDE|nr:hypothetical protein [Streptomyces sp. AS02]MCL8013447.1 hypothetical protein [Streptomyces sp. AS02]
MTPWLMAAFVGVLGYLGGWLQHKLGERAGRENAQRELMRSMRDRLLRLRDMDDEPPPTGHPLLRELQVDAELLRHKQLRARIGGDLASIRLWLLAHQSEQSVRYAFADDALKCLTVFERGERRIPSMDEHTRVLGFVIGRHSRNLYARLEPPASSVPDCLQHDYEAWKRTKIQQRGLSRYIRQTTLSSRDD